MDRREGRRHWGQTNCIRNPLTRIGDRASIERKPVRDRLFILGNRGE
jgi:hypothetical protein